MKYCLSIKILFLLLIIAFNSCVDSDYPYFIKDPVVRCMVHVTGGMLGAESQIFVMDEYSEFVRNGMYAYNADTFPKADANTFDSIAIAPSTTVTFYSEQNFQGNILLQKTGPAIILNVIWFGGQYHFTETLTYDNPRDQEIYPPSVREWSGSDMWYWSTGSLVVDCY